MSTTLTAAQIADLLRANPDLRAAVKGELRAVSKEPRPCGCGCGAPTARRFAIGHDAKLKSRLIAAFRAGEAVPTCPAHPDVTDPLAAATALGWAGFLTPAKVKAPKAEAPKAAPAKVPVRESAKTKAAKAQAEVEAAAIERAERKAS